jgi:UDP:flavonoid glycosyltransferase YjiC (YdhE family)
MTKPAVVFFAMRQEGHFDSLRPLISGLTGRGVVPHVFTDREFEGPVEQAGGRFVDLFAKYPVERADDESLPAPCRYVTFAGYYAEEILRDLEAIRPSLVIYDAHAVIGRVVGAALGIPYVSVCPAHNVHPDRLLPLLSTLPRIHVSSSCERSVEKLRAHYDLKDASPFSFVSWLSPFLNIYGEPPSYLTEAERRALEPVAFHGCLPTIEEIEAKGRAEDPRYFDADTTRLKVYVSFGTVVWRYFPSQALEAVRVISDSFARMDDISSVISLGGAEVPAERVHAFAKPNVSVVRYADQWKILQEAEAFVTHNGLKSTHEAIVSGVPMISYPFFWDQAALAEKCRTFGLAIPLADSPPAPPEDGDVRAAVTELQRTRESLSASMDEARGWELETIARRDTVLRRIIDLIPD